MLAATSKVLERTVQTQLVKHMDTNLLWNRSLHSYRQNHSSTTALAQIHNTTTTASDNKEIATLIAVDESAAFDTIDHIIFLNKMRMYKIGDKTLKWIENYLSSRSQYVTLGGQDSHSRIHKYRCTPRLNPRSNTIQYVHKLVLRNHYGTWRM